MTGVELWILILGLFFPRLTLFIAYMSHNIPYNTVPLIGDLVFTLFVPNVLLGSYALYHDMPVWGTIHIILGILRFIDYFDFSNCEHKN